MHLAALQMQAVTGNVEANISRIARAAREAAANGADLLVAPELAVTGYGAGEAFRDLATPPDGQVAEAIGRIARETGLAIVTGFPERAGDTVYNSALVTDGKSLRNIYRKSHLYGTYERAWFKPEPPASVLANVGGVTIGVLICYDVEFPENVRRLAQAGADLVVVPTALPEGWSGSFIADKMIQVRAFENQVFVAYVNHCGADEAFTYAGLSRIVAPDGTLLAKAPAEGEMLLSAIIRPDEFARSRAENTYLADLIPPA
ncbi:carbon-nitrogen hydrolase family protein [Rhizobium sp. BK251]|uniref:carbon-nitrogen hydrolase family protein n=1 Tax=Rhizobium sp. BK251 TaxID=2512125 RepID=UPI00104CCC51|nr:carbon-nitrogen hydrolase family protein [Rhizobium sp. BK251]TCL68131.1 putative amidohydrolase [Rhizobium sp. BK251]